MGLLLGARVHNALTALLSKKSSLSPLIPFFSFIGCEVQNSQDLTLRVFQFSSYQAAAALAEVQIASSVLSAWKIYSYDFELSTK